MTVVVRFFFISFFFISLSAEGHAEGCVEGGARFAARDDINSADYSSFFFFGTHRLCSFTVVIFFCML